MQTALGLLTLAGVAWLIYLTLKRPSGLSREEAARLVARGNANAANLTGTGLRVVDISETIETIEPGEPS